MDLQEHRRRHQMLMDQTQNNQKEMRRGKTRINYWQLVVSAFRFARALQNGKAVIIIDPKIIATKSPPVGGYATAKTSGMLARWKDVRKN